MVQDSGLMFGLLLLSLVNLGMLLGGLTVSKTAARNPGHDQRTGAPIGLGLWLYRCRHIVFSQSNPALYST